MTGILKMEDNYLYAFSQLYKWFGPVRLRQLKAYFGSWSRAWRELNPCILKEFGWQKEAEDGEFWAKKRSVDPESYNWLKKANINFVSEEGEDYPVNLKGLPDPPAWLYFRGSFQPNDALALAVVGTRKMTSYGQRVVENLVPDLVRHGITIVSGLAFGVDSLAHEVALASGGRTLAVLASGVDQITPTTQTSLAEKIITLGRGAVISEFPLKTSPQPFHFPIRNRLISGLSLGVIIVEAAQKSGSLITAGCALEQGREVFCVPGSIFSPYSVGTHKLIQEGAKLVKNVEDILDELNLEITSSQVTAKNTLPETGEEATILNLLSGDPLLLDEIIRLSGLTTASVCASLTVLEMKGMVKNVGSNQFCRV